MKKNALRTYVMKVFGPEGFTKRGTIKVSLLKKLKATGSKITSSRANYALNARKWKRRGDRGSVTISIAVVLVILVLFVVFADKLGLSLGVIIHDFKVFIYGS